MVGEPFLQPCPPSAPGGLFVEGKKVRVTIRFRGREITYPELALEDLKEIAEELEDIATIEQAPKLEGRAMSMLLSPNPKKIAKYKAEMAAKGIVEEPVEDDIDDEEDDDEADEE